MQTAQSKCSDRSLEISRPFQAKSLDRSAEICSPRKTKGFVGHQSDQRVSPPFADDRAPSETQRSGFGGESRRKRNGGSPGARQGARSGAFDGDDGGECFVWQYGLCLFCEYCYPINWNLYNYNIISNAIFARSNGKRSLSTGISSNPNFR